MHRILLKSQYYNTPARTCCGPQPTHHPAAVCCNIVTLMKFCAFVGSNCNKMGSLCPQVFIFLTSQRISTAFYFGTYISRCWNSVFPCTVSAW